MMKVDVGWMKSVKCVLKFDSQVIWNIPYKLSCTPIDRHMYRNIDTRDLDRAWNWVALSPPILIYNVIIPYQNYPWNGGKRAYKRCEIYNTKLMSKNQQLFSFGLTAFAKTEPKPVNP